MHFALNIIAFELIAKKLPITKRILVMAANVETNTPKISDTLRQTFFNSIFAKVMKQYDESAVVQFFGLFNMLTVDGCSLKRDSLDI